MRRALQAGAGRRAPPHTEKKNLFTCSQLPLGSCMGVTLLVLLVLLPQGGKGASSRAAR